MTSTQSKLRHFPEHVIALAKEVYDGEPCEFALADALEEIGCAALAGHFRGDVLPGQLIWRHIPGTKCATAYSIANGDERDLPHEYMRELRYQS